MKELNLDPWQKEFLKTKGDKILCTGRQVGKSVVCGIDAGTYATTNRNKVTLMIAPTERQAYALFEKTLSYIIDNKPNMIMKGRNRPTKSRIKLSNKNTIWCLPTGLTGLGIRFLTVDRLYADEASRIPDAVWTAVTPMLLTTGGDSIYLSTPFGAEGEFYDCFTNKNHAYDSFKRFSTDSEVVMRERKICATWTIKQREKALQRLEQEKARMTAVQYAQEYLGRFMLSLKQVFPDKLIKECMILERLGVKSNRNYYLGVDVGGMGKSESTFEIIDKINSTQLEHVEHQVTKKTRTTDTTEHIIGLNNIYNFKKEYIDSGGPGVGVCDQLRLDENNKRKVVEINNATRIYDRDGTGKEIIEKTKRLMKEHLYNNMLRLMERGEIKLLKDNDIFQSLKSVQYEKVDNKIKIFGNYTHIAEGLIRAAWCVKDKSLNIYIY